MNIIWIVADTLRQDHLGSYGHPYIRTPELDALAKRSTRFNRHYLDGFPTMPARANHHTGRFITRFMGWEPLPEQTTTLAQLLTEAGYHTAAVVDTPFYWRNGMNYDRGFQSFFPVQGQKGSYRWRSEETGHREAIDVVSWWRRESDRCAARTMTLAGDWLERHYREEFFLYVDTWDPHEPWDAPDYYTRLYMPEYDGEIVNPSYTRWQEDSGLERRTGREGARDILRRNHNGRHVDRAPFAKSREHGAERQYGHHLHVRSRHLLRRARRHVRQDASTGSQSGGGGHRLGILAAIRRVGALAPLHIAYRVWRQAHTRG